METVESILEHHGVRGMKWGVRKDRGHVGERAKTRKINRLDKKFDRNRGSLQLFIKLHNAAAVATNKNDIDRINNKPQYKDKDFRKDSPLRQKYYKEHQRAYLNNLHKAADDLGTNASGTKKYAVVETPDGSWDVFLEDVKHAEGDTEAFHVKVNIDYDEAGHILRILQPSTSLKQAEDFTENFLEHYGVRGMRWGIRRSASALGRGVNKTIIKSPPKTRVSLGKPGPKHSEDAKKAAAARAKVHGRKNTKALSNDELQALVKRMNLEQQFVRLQGDSKKVKITKKGGSLAAEILGGAAKQTAKNTASTHMSKLLEELLKKK